MSREVATMIQLAGAQRALEELGPALGPVLAHVRSLDAHAFGAVRDDLVVFALELVTRRGEHFVRSHAKQLRARIAERAAAGAVHVQEAHGGAIDEVDRVVGHVHRGTKALQVFGAPALLALGALAHEELADLAADDAHGLQHTRVRLARVGAREADHADRALASRHRECERAAVVLVFPHLGRRDPPALVVAQHAVVVGAEVASGGPALRFANFLNHGPDARLRRFRLREASRGRMLEREQRLFAFARGDVAADAAIAAEPAGGVELRLAADRQGVVRLRARQCARTRNRGRAGGRRA